MRSLWLASIIGLIALACSKKHNTPQCVIPEIVPFQPYSGPTFHPNTQLLGFNYTPLAAITPNGNAPCLWYAYLAKSDSTGFYLMNKDGSGLKRVTTYKLLAPAWSPDGKWLAFCLGNHIYKMPFDGNTFDTTQIIQLTNTGANFYPSWTSNGDTIYFDSNTGANNTGYSVWKMAADGSGKTAFSNTGRQPFVASNGRVYYVRGVLGQQEVFSMNKDGSNQTQVTFNGKSGNRNNPKYYQESVYYHDNGSLHKLNGAGIDTKLAFPCVGFDISSLGEIVYSKMEFSITTYNKQIGTLWLIAGDGNSDRQLTFNYF